MTTPEEHAKTLAEKARKERFYMLASRAEGGALESRPMTVQEVDGWSFRFIAQASDDVIVQSDGEQVNLSVMNGGTYVSLSGVGSVSRDVPKKIELWGRLNEAYAGEPEDPDNVILTIEVHSGAYWDAGSPVTRVLGLAKAALTGEAPSGASGSAAVG